MSNTTLKSKRTNCSYETEIYVKQNNEHIVAYIIPHKFLEEVYQNLEDMERPKISYTPVDMNCFPGMQPMWAMKAIMERDDFYMEKIGEFTNYEIRNGVCNDVIKMQNPLTICMNRAFDKLMIRYMQFEVENSTIIPIYSSEEISITDKSIHPYQNSPVADIPKSENQDGMMDIPEAPEMSAPVPENLFSDLGTATENSPEAPNPFPYANGGMNFDGYPDMGDMDIPTASDMDMPTAPDMDIPLPPMPGMENRDAPLKKLTVLRVSHDCQSGRTRIDTDDGPVYYNPFTDSFEGKASIDYDDLYSQASAMVGQLLQTYVGPII